MQRTMFRNRGRSRRGLTLIDVIVVIVAVLLLLWFVVATTVRSRGPSRRLECQSHLKELTTATLNYAGNHQGQIPDLRTSLPGQCRSAVSPSVPEAVSFHFTLLPYLDIAGAVEYIEQQTNPSAANTALMTVLSNEYRTFTCPDDTTHYRKPGGNSYVANGGYGEFTVAKNVVTMGGRTALHSAENWEHWDAAHAPHANPGTAPSVSPLDKTIARATGMFWIPNSDGWKSSMDEVVNNDGSGQTLMYGENTNASFLNQLTGPTPMDNAFVVGRTAITFTHAAPQYLAFTSIPAPFEFGINSSRGKLVGQSPSPSSMHSRGAIFAFCDGHVRFLADNIDPSVYVRLMSPAGNRWGQLEVNESEY